MVAQPGHAVADDLGADHIMRRGQYLVSNSPADDRPYLPTRRDPQIRRAPSAAGLYDVLDLILDKGIVVDAFVRVSLVGIELLTIDLRVVIASVDTYLRYAEGVERLQIRGDEKSEPKNLPGMVGGGMKAHSISKGAKSVGRMLTGGGGSAGDEDNSQHGVVGALAKGVRRAVGRVAGAISGDPSEYEDQAEQEQGGGRDDGGPPQKSDRGDRERNRDREGRSAKAGSRR